MSTPRMLEAMPLALTFRREECFLRAYIAAPGEEPVCVAWILAQLESDGELADEWKTLVRRMLRRYLEHVMHVQPIWPFEPTPEERCE